MGYNPSNVLKPTKIGNGFEKESVLIYVEELSRKIDEQAERIEELESGGTQDSKLVEEYKRDLQDAQKNAADAQQKAAAAQQAADENAARLKDATDKAAKLAAALKAEKDARSADAQQMKQLLQQAQAQAKSADEGKLRELQQEIISLKGEIGQLTSENTKLKTSATASGELSASVQQLQVDLSAQEAKLKISEGELSKVKEELKKANEDLEKKAAAVAEKETEIADLKNKTSELEAKVTELESKENEATAFAPEFDMSALYADAQKNANQLIVTAKTTAAKMTKDAEDKAKNTIDEANAKATKTVAEANSEAERITKEAQERSAGANAEADAILSKARTQAEKDAAEIKKDAEEQEKRVRQLTATLRSMLTIEIDGFEKRMTQVHELMSQAAKTLTDKFGETEAIIREARESVDETTKNGEEKMDQIMSGEAPAEQAPAPKAAPAPAEAPAAKKGTENFAESMLNDFAAMPDPEANLRKPVKDNEPTPMPKPQKKLNFDMSELIKDAEASVSDDGE